MILICIAELKSKRVAQEDTPNLNLSEGLNLAIFGNHGNSGDFLNRAGQLLYT
jgi:hypothetical protein